MSSTLTRDVLTKVSKDEIRCRLEQFVREQQDRLSTAAQLSLQDCTPALSPYIIPELEQEDLPQDSQESVSSLVDALMANEAILFDFFEKALLELAKRCQLVLGSQTSQVPPFEPGPQLSRDQLVLKLEARISSLEIELAGSETIAEQLARCQAQALTLSAQVQAKQLKIQGLEQELLRWQGERQLLRTRMQADEQTVLQLLQQKVQQRVWQVLGQGLVQSQVV